jgi:hypothetical protein
VCIAEHYHNPLLSSHAHPSLHSLDKKRLNLVEALTKAGAKPRNITIALQQDWSYGTEPAVRIKDVYNAMLRIRVMNLAGRTPIQALLEQFTEDDYISKHQSDRLEHVTHLFFASPQSITLARLYPQLFLLGCTYKTNDYGLPLLVVVGITCMYMSFYAAFTFLPREDKEDFVWALKQLSDNLGISQVSY